MKLLASIAALLLSVSALADSFMPENDLWKQDCLTCENSTNGMTQEIFNEIIAAGKSAYQPFADKNGEKLVINALYTDSTVNANCQRTNGRVIVNMYGGLARRPEINFAAFAIVLSHELSHAYGGKPYIYEPTQMSAEGQADWAATKDAFKLIHAKSRYLQQEINNPEQFMIDNCNDSKLCIDSLAGGKSLGALLAKLTNGAAPRFETPDPLVVTETELSYPSTVQCRLDTYVAGTLGKERPSCWFAGKNALSYFSPFKKVW